MQLRPHQEQAIQSMSMTKDKSLFLLKTICMIMDAVKQLEDYGTVVVVAPHTTCRATMQRVYGNH